MKTSAGLLMYRTNGPSLLEVLLGFPGGPYFKNKDEGYWSIVKGEVEKGEDLLQAACREFQEETGIEPVGPFIPLGSILQKAGKTVHAWAFEMDGELSQIHDSNLITIEWPPKSGKSIQIPEIEKVAYFPTDVALVKILPSQRELITRLSALLGQENMHNII